VGEEDESSEEDIILIDICSIYYIERERER
jgi:hypothetical protein